MNRRTFFFILFFLYSYSIRIAYPLPLYTSEDEEYRLELKGYIKSFSLLFSGMERFLPEEPSRDLEKLSQLFQAMNIPQNRLKLKEQWSQFRDEFALLALQQLWLRLGLRAKIGESASISIAYELRPQLGSNPHLLLSKLPVFGQAVNSFNGLAGGSLFITPFTSFDDRWLDFPPRAYGNHAFRLYHYLERFYFSYSFPIMELTIGRQPISLSMGRLFRPADILAPFSPQEFDTEEKRGVDAVKFDFEISELSELSIIGALQRFRPWEERRAGDKNYFSGLSPAGIARFKWNLWEWDFFILAGYSYGDLVGSIGASGSIWKFGLQLELLYRYPILEPEPEHPGGLWALAVNLEYKFSKPELLLELSYFHQSVGTSDFSNYLKLLSSKRYLRGEAFLLGTDYLAAFFSWKLHPLFSIQTFVMVNLNLDYPSALIGPSFELSLSQDLLLLGAVYIGIGSSPSLETVSGGKYTLNLYSEFGSVGTIGILSIKYYY